MDPLERTGLGDNAFHGKLVLQYLQTVLVEAGQSVYYYN